MSPWDGGEPHPHGNRIPRGEEAPWSGPTPALVHPLCQPGHAGYLSRWTKYALPSTEQ
jgi:hypothetical protein